ncbi:MAG: LPS assembly protein LptD [Mariprofundaceae bacterium]|nr:LPS assembly protein LptD [Mariprofundaceae bacterium]
MRMKLALACGLMVVLSVSDAHARMELLADQVVRDGYGQITADGHVQANRSDEELTSQHLRYDPLKKEVYAKGEVLLTSPHSTIKAASARLHTVNKSGVLEHATIHLSEGQYIQAEHLERLDETRYRGEDITFTECPPDNPAWLLHASRIDIDQESGDMSVRDARFEVSGIPVFYSPYWQYPLRRRSGVLMPVIGTSQRRGTEFALPYYIAPYENWDATFTPRWMTARGLMNDLEFRHISSYGEERWRGALLQDQVTRTRRYQIEGRMHEQWLPGVIFKADVNQTSDNQYLSDFSVDGAQASARYINSQASLGWQGRWGRISVLGKKQQDLTLVDNSTTLQWLPRFDMALAAPLWGDAVVHLDQQTTRFARPKLISGWRAYTHPWLEVPFTPLNGAVELTFQTGVRQWNYSQLRNNPSRADRARAYEASLVGAVHVERVSENRHWRHELSPTVRFDYATAPNQSALPQFDTAFSRLTINNLMQGNRFTGQDRVERMKRLSATVHNEVQFKDEDGGRKWTVFSADLGTAWDFLRSSVDPALSPVPLRNYANLLGAFKLSPTPEFHFSADGQYDPVARYWATVNAAFQVQHKGGHHLSLTWQHTDNRYVPTAINLVGLDLSALLYRRWRFSSVWQYDSVLKLTQQATGSLAYEHPCWNISLEAYRLNRQGTAGNSDSGFRFMLGFKGLGSVGGA